MKKELQQSSIGGHNVNIILSDCPTGGTNTDSEKTRFLEHENNLLKQNLSLMNDIIKELKGVIRMYKAK